MIQRDLRSRQEVKIIKKASNQQVWNIVAVCGLFLARFKIVICCKVVQQVWLRCVAGWQTNPGMGKEGMWGMLAHLHFSLCQLLIMLNYTFNTSGPLWTFLRVWGQAFPVSMNDPTSGELSCMGLPLSLPSSFTLSIFFSPLLHKASIPDLHHSPVTQIVGA